MSNFSDFGTCFTITQAISDRCVHLAGPYHEYGGLLIYMEPGQYAVGVEAFRPNIHPSKNSFSNFVTDGRSFLPWLNYSLQSYYRKVIECLQNSLSHAISRYAYFDDSDDAHVLCNVMIKQGKDFHIINGRRIPVIGCESRIVHYIEFNLAYYTNPINSLLEKIL